MCELHRKRISCIILATPLLTICFITPANLGAILNSGNLLREGDQGIWSTNTIPISSVYEDVYDWVGANVSQSPIRLRTFFELIFFFTGNYEQFCSS